MAPTIRAALAIAALALAAHAGAGQWKQLRKDPGGELWIDNASIKHNAGEAMFDYRVDFPKPQQELESKNKYRSTVTRAIVRCATRTISVGPTVAYAGPRATGKEVGRYPPTPEEARFQPVESGSSDESLWNHVCSVAQVIPKN
jgi:hypothetical protein